jgi:hypothetical protein
MDWITLAVIIATTTLTTLFIVAAWEFDHDSRHRP